ncbi:MAG: sugar phosphate isomerase/epimerase [Planctomycetota bacterium]
MIGLQLYSVRRLTGGGFPNLLKVIKEMGFAGVELAGLRDYCREPATLRKLLDDASLQCCGAHVRLSALCGDKLKETVAFSRAIGNRFLIVPWMILLTRQGCQERAGFFSAVADKLKAEGLYIGYHAHSCDFRLMAGTTPWDEFFSHTGPDVVMQLDTGNCLRGGADPATYLARYPGRARTMHLKEYGGRSIGEGCVPWRQVLDLCAASGRTEWLIIEDEGGGAEALRTVQRSLDNLRGLLSSGGASLLL